MSAIFLSASVPQEGREKFFETADPFLIQCAVRELFVAVIQNYKVVWGGHPAITPMVLAICEDLQVDYSEAVVLYQSKYFQQYFPEENKNFKNIIYVDAIENDRERSLELMRREMLSRSDLEASVFIGGMEGIEVEYQIFKEYHPDGKVLPIGSPGGAARDLALKLFQMDEEKLSDVNFARIFHAEFPS